MRLFVWLLMAALYTCSLSLGLPSQPRIPSLGSHGRSTQTPRNTRHISSLPIQESARWVSHWSQYKCEPSYWLWGECDQPLGPDRHHIQRSHNLLLISPSYSDQDGKLSTYQNTSIHFMTCDRVQSLWWGPNVYFVFPSEKNRWCGDDDAFWAPYGESLNSFIAGHKTKKKMKLFLVPDCESSWQR